MLDAMEKDILHRLAELKKFISKRHTCSEEEAQEWKKKNWKTALTQRYLYGQTFLKCCLSYRPGAIAVACTKEYRIQNPPGASTEMLGVFGY